ncbi:MAG TPA: tetratricopeptide repeat protein [Thermoanaerobaculia bacterium]|jgi:tetratricopeptide (TPR) repeat protein
MRRILVLLVMLALSLPIFAATGADLAASGRAALQKGDADTAAKLFEQAVAAEPRNAVYHYLLGGAYGEQAQKSSMFSAAGLAKKALAELTKAVELDPNYTEARLGLIDYYLVAPGFMGGSRDKALAQVAEIKKRDALQGHRAMARVHTRDKKYDLARAEFVQAVREQPSSMKAHYFLAVAYVNEKNWTAAQQELDAAMKLDASYMPIYFRIGQLAARSGLNLARGEEALRKYLRYNPPIDEPGLASAWFQLGTIQEKQGKKADAKQSYVNAQKLAPSSKEVSEALKRVS